MNQIITVCCIVILILFSAGGCAPAKKRSPPQRPQAGQDQADVLMANGDYRGAADIYQQKARQSGDPQRDRYLARAVNALEKAGDDKAARQLAKRIDPAKLAPRQRDSLYLFMAQSDLHADDYEGALSYLEKISPERLSRDSKLQYHYARINVYEQLDNKIDAVRERSRIDELLDNPDEKLENNSAILNILTYSSNEDLDKLEDDFSDTLVGWVALARILKRYIPGSVDYEAKISRWQVVNRGHPADQYFLDNYLESHRQEYIPPQAVAVMLPESGPYARAARVIEDSMMSARFEQEEGGILDLRFYDSTAADPYTVYQTAVSEGAELVVGPLDKQNIEALLAAGDLSVPILALNQVSGAQNRNVYQFGLNPEDEAEQVANIAWLDGHQNALVLTPQSSLGERISTYFQDYWKRLGGEVLEAQSYDSQESDFSEPIKSLLNLDEREQRYKRLKKIFKNLKFEPDLRQDVDLIFVVGYPREARLLRPQLQFYRASGIPVYATSHVYSGQQNPSEDQDLSDLVFCDIPFILNEAGYTEPNDGMAQKNSRLPIGIYRRLTALGIDTYNIIPHLYRLRKNPDTPFKGLTGMLTVTPGKRIHRQLYCAQFKNGIPRVRGLAPVVEPAEEADLTEDAETNEEFDSDAPESQDYFWDVE